MGVSCLIIKSICNTTFVVGWPQVAGLRQFWGDKKYPEFRGLNPCGPTNPGIERATRNPVLFSRPWSG